MFVTGIVRLLGRKKTRWKYRSMSFLFINSSGVWNSFNIALIEFLILFAKEVAKLIESSLRLLSNIILMILIDREKSSKLLFCYNFKISLSIEIAIRDFEKSRKEIRLYPIIPSYIPQVRCDDSKNQSLRCKLISFRFKNRNHSLR